MNVYVIFKQLLDSQGQVTHTEIIEVDMNELMAQRFSKLYGLQTPVDLRGKIQYSYIAVKVN